jgi:sporulation protein YabP
MAYDDKYVTTEIPHTLHMEGRKKLSVSGITDVESFNEQGVIMASTKWTLAVRGDNLHMEKLSVDSGDVIITGRIDMIEYEDGSPAGEGFFARLFK